MGDAGSGEGALWGVYPDCPDSQPDEGQDPGIYQGDREQSQAGESAGGGTADQ